MIVNGLKLILLLFAAHALCDYPLQGEFLSKGKNRHKSPYLAWCPWYWCMTAHCLIHAGAVLLITNSVWLGLTEFAVHFITDFSKCEDWIGMDADQTIHLGVKILWMLAVMR